MRRRLTALTIAIVAIILVGFIATPTAAAHKSLNSTTTVATATLDQAIKGAMITDFKLTKEAVLEGTALNDHELGITIANGADKGLQGVNTKAGTDHQANGATTDATKTDNKAPDTSTAGTTTVTSSIISVGFAGTTSGQVNKSATTDFGKATGDQARK